MSFPAIDARTCVIRNTAAKKGRTLSVLPGKTASQQLQYGRIILEERATVGVDTGMLETGLVSLKGEAAVEVDGRQFILRPYDALYVPRDSRFVVTAGAGGCDLAEIAAPVEQRYPVQFVAYADVQRDTGLHFTAGSDASRRELNILLGKNIEAGRIMAGVTFSQPGNWTSWPPHEHAALAEEAYLYIDMPRPAFGVQLVYASSSEPELATIVHEGDVVLMPQGYHPNVAAPGGSINFLWMMVANREREDRLYGVVNVHPDFGSISSGLDAGRSKR
jgi:5-deoxy-glucuronate isomerase